VTFLGILFQFIKIYALSILLSTHVYKFYHSAKWNGFGDVYDLLVQHKFSPWVMYMSPYSFKIMSPSCGTWALLSC